MGIVQRQSFWNLTFTILGVLLGYVNKLYFYSEWLEKAEFGLIELLLAVMIIGSEFSMLGVGKVITRFFPYFKGRGIKEGQFVSFVASYGLLGFLGLTLFLLIFKPIVVVQFGENSPLFVEHYLYLIPLCLAYAAYRVLQGISQALLKSVVPIFAFHFALRLYQSFIIILYFLDVLNFIGLLNAFVWGYYLPAGIILAYLIWLKKFEFSWSLAMWKSRMGRLLLLYGGFVALSETSMVLLGRIDAVMVGKILGEIQVGPYAIAIYIATLVAIPARSISNIVMPLLGIHVKNRDWKSVSQLYQKNAMFNLLLGSLLLIGIWVNLDPYFTLSPKHVAGRDAALIIAIGFWFGIAAGPNRQIIMMSRHFRFDLYLNLILVVLAIIGNVLLIPQYGLVGAAMATSVTLSLYNISGVSFLWIKMKLFPYTSKTLIAVAAAVLVLLIGLYMPAPESPLLEMLCRSLVVTVTFGAIVLGLRLLPDANDMLRHHWKKWVLRR